MKKTFKLLGIVLMIGGWLCLGIGFTTKMAHPINTIIFVGGLIMLFVGVIILGTIRIGLLEEFKILLLNRRNRVLGVVNISHGGLSGTVADPIERSSIILNLWSCEIESQHHFIFRNRDIKRLLNGLRLYTEISQ
ncbi:hypothetical protein SAMN04488084_11019 [Pedobacter antarcticus]|nr:hypothetical protein [Pedobacter antarcticus]SDM63206.1 hypothetical protein SAMN04488084_11019 [Pedobacter antarcticus]